MEKFFATGSKAGINPQFAPKLRLMLTLLNIAKWPKAMDVPGYELHELKGEMAGTCPSK